MAWWVVLIALFGGIGIVFGFYMLGRRAIWMLNGFVRGILPQLFPSYANTAEETSPRSLSSMESVLLPQVLRDFPEYNSSLIAERVRRDAKTYYESGIAKQVLYTEEVSNSFKQSFAASLPSGVKKDVRIHRVALHAYDTRGRDRILTYQAAAQYIDTADAVRQKRLVLKYLAAFTNDPETEIKTFNCPNCGAPLPIIGSKNCRYCGTALKTPPGLGWLLIEAFED